MSLFGTTASRTGTHPDQYDHAINLVDHTKSQAPAPDPDVEAQATSSRASSTPSTPKDGPSGGGGLTKRLTGTTLREELTKRKYAKYQERRYSAGDDDGREEVGSQDGGASTPGDPMVPTETQDSSGTRPSNIETSDFAPRQSHEERGRLRTMGKKITSRFSGPKGAKQRKQGESEVDILYENQRGWFMFGIPLYSHKSLLNLDPAPWVTREFKDSAVNITNAQLPDPSWEWAWKSWYVDMSYDVDEEGWQYSFGFSPRYSWHGTHPWFHNFVRRRRWLRKRVKRSSRLVGKAGSMQQAHLLNPDYFTIHGTKREISGDRSTDGHSSYRSYPSTVADEEEVDTSEIKDTLALMKILRRATVDREKIDAVKKFIEQGGEELYYLEEHIPEIMSTFIYQNSRRQLLSYLLRTVKDAREHRGKHVDSGDPESVTEKRRIDNLLKAVRAADEQVRNLEYWSDVKHVAKGNKGEEKLRLSKGSTTEEGMVGQLEDITPGLKGGKDMGSPKTDIGEDIKGIPDEAGLEQEGLKAVFESGGPERSEGSTDKKADENEKPTEDKGKGKAVDEDEENVPALDISVD